jgi:FtsH-binding integral membrane protein
MLSFMLIAIGLLFSVVSVACIGVCEMISHKNPSSDKYGKYMMGYFCSLCVAIVPLMAGIGGIVENTNNPWYLLLVLAYTILYFGSMSVICGAIKRKYERS